MNVRKFGIGAAAALALSSSGCAAILAELGIDVNGGAAPATPGATRGQLAAAKADAEATANATEIARRADDVRDAPVGQYQVANTMYRQALELEPRNTYVLAAQATSFVREAAELRYSGEGGTVTANPAALRRSDTLFKRAMALVNQSLKVNPNYGTAHFIAGEIYALQGDFPKALEKFDFIERQKIIPEGHTSSFYAWRGYAKKASGQDATTDLQQAQEFNEPIEFGEYAEGLLNPQPAAASTGRPTDYRAVIRAL